MHNGWNPCVVQSVAGRDIYAFPHSLAPMLVGFNSIINNSFQVGLPMVAENLSCFYITVIFCASCLPIFVQLLLGWLLIKFSDFNDSAIKTTVEEKKEMNSYLSPKAFVQKEIWIQMEFEHAFKIFCVLKMQIKIKIWKLARSIVDQILITWKYIFFYSIMWPTLVLEQIQPRSDAFCLQLNSLFFWVHTPSIHTLPPQWGTICVHFISIEIEMIL